MQIPPVSLVLGGAASGKSAWAERLVRQSGLAKVYIASAQAFDAEMEAKIAEHRAQRAGDGWRTVEAPVDVPQAIAALDAEEIALFDCATLWLSNLTLAGRDPGQEVDTLCQVVDFSPAPLVLVSNELGHGIVPADRETRRFRDTHGKMNQSLAEVADLVVFVTAGLPQVLKGTLP
ncbi:MAG: bifunctional adenosylcobinamide kinase/adenosylcobinamide-phosphate guanylyltransferase [Pseudomonadota bacterium]